VGNRAYLLSLPFAPHAFGERPPSGAVAFAMYSVPFFWASLFDARSIARPFPGTIHGLASLRLEAVARSERRLRACAMHFRWSSWPVAERWLEFLHSLAQPWIAVDVHDIEYGLPEVTDILRRVDASPDDLEFTDYFGRFFRDRPAEEAVVLAGVDHEDYAPPRPLMKLHSSAPPSGPQFVWKQAVEGLLGDRDPTAWMRWFPGARTSLLRSDVAVIGPNAFIWYEADVQAWTVLIASCELAAMKVLGLPTAGLSIPPLDTDVALAAQVVDPSMVTYAGQPPYAVLLSSRRAACSSTLRRQA
jgi:hypothetical protein